ncbi:MAG: 3-phosphoglycerate dehydrogenase family protein [Spirochaetaceae bacterium]
MTVLVADSLPEYAHGRLEETGCSLVYDPGLKDAALVDAIRAHTPEVVVVRSTKVPAAAIEAHGGLNLVVRAGAGYNNIDVDTASARSVYVANCPGKNSIAVAELAVGLLLSLDRRIPDNVADLREHRWNKQEYATAAGLYGRTLGVIGLGRIGREVASRARAFGMSVVAWSRSLTPEAAQEIGIRRLDSPVDVARAADAVSVHLAATEETRGLLGKAFFDALKPGAYFINTARAEVLDEQALSQAVREKGVRAALDVFAGEPSGKQGAVEAEIFDLPLVYGTHHIGASTEQAQNAVADEVVRIVSTYMQSGRVLNCVNTARRTPARYIVSIHHRNRVGVLAAVLGVIREHGINVDAMENVLFEGGEGACANIQIEAELPADALEQMKTAHGDVLSVNAHEITRDQPER